MEFRFDVCSIVPALLLTLVASADSSAQTNATQSGNWSAPATWDAGEPTDTLQAVINGGHTVTIDSAGETTNLLDVGTIDGETGNLEITGGDLFVTDSDTVAEPNIPSIRIGQAAGSTGNFTMSGGEVFIDGGADTGFAIGDLLVGDVGTGTMDMTGGDLTATDEILIGLLEGSNGTVNVSGGSLNAGGRSIVVGFDGTGELNVSDDAIVSANFDVLVALVEGSTGRFNQSGGTVTANFMFSNAFTEGTGSTAEINMTGGTFNANIAYVLGQGNGTTTMNHSGGTINAPTNNGDFVVGDGDGNTSVYNMSGTASVNLLHSFLVGVFDGPEGPANGTVNQTGGAITAGDHLVVGRDGIGTYNISGGAVNVANVFLGDFDSSTGTMKITGGTLNLTGNFNVGGALASNAAPDRVEPDGNNGPQGQALDANGVLIISGTGGEINVGGNFRANPDDKSEFRRDPFIEGADNSSTLVFEIFDAAGTSLIDVAGVADLDGAVIDLDLMGGFTPSAGATFDLLEAASFGATGTGTTEDVGTGDGFTLAAEDVGSFSLAVVPGAGVEILRATFLAEPPGVPGDYNGNGIVDAADYVLWRNGGPLANEVETPDMVTEEDYAAWRARFGNTAGGGAGSVAAAVPEPSAWMLVALSAMLGLGRLGRK